MTFRPDRPLAIVAGILLIGGTAFEAALAGLLLFLISGGGYAATAHGRLWVAIGAILWLVAALPCAVAAFWACREVSRSRRQGFLALLGLNLVALGAGVVMESPFVLGATLLIVLLCAVRLGGWGPTPQPSHVEEKSSRHGTSL